MVGEGEVRPGSVRVSDAQRREVDQQLQRATGEGLLTLGEYDERSAVVWAARTRDDLTAATHDLPAAVAGTSATAGTATTPAASGHARARWAVAVMSEERLSGPVLPGQSSHSLAVMGHGVIDLRRSDLPPVVNVSATSIMGAIEVLVPEGARVEANGIAVMGSRDVQVAPAMPGAPLIRVHATAVMGHVEVRHKKLGRKDARREGMAHRLDGERASATDRGLARAERRTIGQTGTTRQRQMTRHHGRNRRGVIGLVAAVLVVTAGGAVTAAVTGDQVDAFGSQTVTVSPGQSRLKVAQFFGDTTVALQPGQCATVTGTHVFGSVQNNAPCGVGHRIVAIRADGAFGSVEIDPAP